MRIGYIRDAALQRHDDHTILPRAVRASALPGIIDPTVPCSVSTSLVLGPRGLPSVTIDAHATLSPSGRPADHAAVTVAQVRGQVRGPSGMRSEAAN